MQHRHHGWFLIILALMVTDCTIYSDGQVWQVQAASPPIITATPLPAETSDLPLTPSPTTPPNPAEASNETTDTCPITLPPDPPFVPPAPYPNVPPAPYPDVSRGGYFWYGNNALWTAIPQDGVWSELPHNPTGYSQKVFWWREGYSWTEEPEPQLTVTGQRLDAAAPPLSVSRATNAFAADIQSAMLVGVDFPTPGCWEIAGRYKDHELSFVVRVEP